MPSLPNDVKIYFDILISCADIDRHAIISAYNGLELF